MTTTTRAIACCAPAGRRTVRSLVRPRADVYELDDAFVVNLAAPGGDAERIEVTIDRGVLTAHVPVADQAPEDSKRLLSEFGAGDYHRQFRVGEDVDIEAISASYEQGVLKIRVPKQAGRARTIPVTTG